MCCFAPSNITISSFPLALPTEQILSLLRSGSAGQLQEHIHIHLQEIHWILYPVVHLLFMIIKRRAWENNCSDIPAFYQLNQGATFHVRHTWRVRSHSSTSHFSSSSTVSQLQLETKFLSQDLPDRSDWRSLRRHNSGNTENIFNRFEFQGNVRGVFVLIANYILTTC